MEVSDVFLCSTESAWLEWWTKFGVQVTPTTTHPLRNKSGWNQSFTEAIRDQQTLSDETTMRWNTFFTDVVTGLLTSRKFIVLL